MRRIVNSTYMSLDGVVQHPENWTFDYRSDDAAQFGHDQLFSSDALLMGRRTYDIFVEHWPKATDDAGFADRMNALPKYVVSNTLTNPSWSNTTVVNGDITDQIRKLKDAPGQDILQYGYGAVTAHLLRVGLLDELRIWLHPLLVGGSEPDTLLFHEQVEAQLQLVSTQPYESGMVILTYQPDHGSNLGNVGP